MDVGKPKSVRAIRPNAGVEARYREQLDKLITEMIQSYDYWLHAAYKKDPPVVAQDAKRGLLKRLGPKLKIEKTLTALGNRWQAKFDEMSENIADIFALGMQKTSDTAFASALKDAGWTVKFKMDTASRNILKATIAENVSLIKSIPSQYATEVNGIVMRAYTRGRDLSQMSDELRSRYGVTKRRAALISRDQSAKATSAMHTNRQIEMGITKAIWQHSSAAKVPRVDHVKAHGKEYDVAKGCYIGGEYIFPGQLINCGCTSKSILPF